MFRVPCFLFTNLHHKRIPVADRTRVTKLTLTPSATASLLELGFPEKYYVSILEILSEQGMEIYMGTRELLPGDDSRENERGKGVTDPEQPSWECL